MRRDPSLKKFILYGDLGKRFGRVHWAAVGSVGEFTRQALPARCPGYLAYMQERWDQPFRVIRGEEDLDEKGINGPIGRTEVIKIVPLVAGAKDQWVTFVAAAILIYVTAGAAGGSIAAGWGASAGMVSAGSALGYSMLLGGVASLLAPAPGQNSGGLGGSKDAATWAFGSPTLTTGQGGAIPVLLGEMRIGGHVVSAGIDAQTWQKGGFGGLCATDDGLVYGNGDSIPWAWAIDES